MPKSNPERFSLSRRELIIGATATAVALATPAALASPTSRSVRRSTEPGRILESFVRSMAASTVLADGRLFVTGGYERPWSDIDPPAPTRSAAIFDPGSGLWTVVVSMHSPRARHAATTLSDGRVVVLGGVGMNPTPSVEVFDPSSNRWYLASPLALPRFDHSAVSDGSVVYVVGGTVHNARSSTESLEIKIISR